MLERKKLSEKKIQGISQHFLPQALFEELGRFLEIILSCASLRFILYPTYSAWMLNVQVFFSIHTDSISIDTE